MTTDPARRLGRVPGRPGAAPGGFTLVELLVVVAIVAIASAAVALAVRDPATAQLEREAARLAVLLEAARAEARASGQPVLWVPGDGRGSGAASGSVAAGSGATGLGTTSWSATTSATTGGLRTGTQGVDAAWSTSTDGLPQGNTPRGIPANDTPNAEPRADFRFLGLPPTVRLPQRWLGAEVTAEVIGSPTLLLGPEPLIGAQRVALSLGDRRLVLATDGLGPFAVVETDPGSGEARP